MDLMDMMEKIERTQDQIKILQEKMDAIARYLKMDFKWNPETYEMMKPEDMAKEMQMPTSIR